MSSLHTLSSSSSAMDAEPNASSQQLYQALNTTLDALNSVVLGKEKQLKLSLACLLAKGHLLIEDLPGMGKTTLSHALAKVLGLSYQRVQFTSDLLPSDILGASIYNRDKSEFQFIEGPVFTQILLADEVNRSTPKTQSALLEAMEERQVTVDGKTRDLPEPFFVIATQNPHSQSGTYTLPESQLDRFLMRVELGYPDAAAERHMLQGSDGRAMLEKLEQTIDLPCLYQLQQQVLAIKASDAVLDYLQRLIEYSRTAADFKFGLSPRGSLAILQAARAWALLHQRSHLIPEDIQTILPAVATHRLSTASGIQGGGAALVAQMIDRVNVL